MVALIQFCFGVSSVIPKSVVLCNILAPSSAFVCKTTIQTHAHVLIADDCSGL